MSATLDLLVALVDLLDAMVVHRKGYQALGLVSAALWRDAAAALAEAGCFIAALQPAVPDMDIPPYSLGRRHPELVLPRLRKVIDIQRAASAAAEVPTTEVPMQPQEERPDPDPPVLASCLPEAASHIDRALQSPGQAREFLHRLDVALAYLDSSAIQELFRLLEDVAGIEEMIESTLDD